MDIDQSFVFQTDAVPNEDRIWNRNIAPLLNEAAANVRQICQYGFTEMLNNAITHSGSTEIKISVSANDLEITFDIIDNGIGIFLKIQNDLDLDDPRDSILELAKGKYTSEPENHSGEGIFLHPGFLTVFQYVQAGCCSLPVRMGTAFWKSLRIKPPVLLSA
jgi:anti-sigma regulatory factor (Ser/Thr protein kinase)